MLRDIPLKQTRLFAGTYRRGVACVYGVIWRLKLKLQDYVRAEGAIEQSTVFRLSMIRIVAAMIICIVPVKMAFAGSANVDSLTILHSGETYGLMTGVEDRGTGKERILGGMARRMAAINAIKRSAPSLLLLDSGNFLGPDYLAAYRNGADVVSLYNLAGYDAVALGKHDFGHGLLSLEERLREAEFVALSANMVFRDPDFPVKPWTIFDRGGIRTGVFGLTGVEVLRDINPAYLEGVLWAEPAPGAMEAVEALRAQGVDTIICLSNLGVQADIELAHTVPGIDLVISGNIREIEGSFDTVSNIRLAGGTIISALPRYGTMLGKMKASAEIGADKTRITDIGRIELSGREDSVIRDIVGRMEAAWAALNQGELGSLDSTCKEEFVQVMLDIIRHETNAEVAFINSGAVLFDLTEPEIGIGDIERMIPFANRLVVLELTPAQLQSLEGLSRTRKEKARLIFSGWKNSRVNGRAPRGDERIRCVTIEFLANGGDGYSMLASVSRRENFQTMLKDAVVEGMRNRILEDPAVMSSVNNHRVILRNARFTGTYRYSSLNPDAALYSGQTVPGLAGADAIYLTTELDYNHDQLTAERSWENNLNLRYDTLNGKNSLDRARLTSYWNPESARRPGHRVQVDTVMVTDNSGSKTRPLWLSKWSGYNVRLNDNTSARAGVTLQYMRSGDINRTNWGAGLDLNHKVLRWGALFITDITAFHSFDDSRVLRLEARQKAEWDITDMYAFTVIGEEFYYRTRDIGKMARRRQIFAGITAKLGWRNRR